MMNNDKITRLKTYNSLYNLKFKQLKKEKLSDDKASRKANVYAVQNTEFFYSAGSYIDTLHNRNKITIDLTSLKIGDILYNESMKRSETITNIHPLYGWLSTDKGDKQKVPQSPFYALTDNDWIVTS